MKPARAGDEDLHRALGARSAPRLLERAQLRVLAEAVEAADRDVDEARRRRRETRRAGDRSGGSARAASRPAAPRRSARRARAAPRPAASCSDSAWRDRRRAIRPTRAADRRRGVRRARRQRRARARRRRSSAHGGDRTGARSSRDSLRRDAASGRESGCAAPSRTPDGRGSRKAAPIARRKLRRERSSASRHSTQSCAASPTAMALLRAEAQPRLLDHARAAGAGDFYGIIAAAGIDDQRLRREADGIEALRKLRTGVARDDHEAQFGKGRRGEDRTSRRASGQQSLRCDMRRRARPILRATHRQVTRRPATSNAAAASSAAILVRRIR